MADSGIDFRELMWLSGFSLILFIFFLPETSSSNILCRSKFDAACDDH